MNNSIDSFVNKQTLIYFSKAGNMLFGTRADVDDAIMKLKSMYSVHFIKNIVKSKEIDTRFKSHSDSP